MEEFYNSHIPSRDFIFIDTISDEMFLFAYHRENGDITQLIGHLFSLVIPVDVNDQKPNVIYDNYIASAKKLYKINNKDEEILFIYKAIYHIGRMRFKFSGPKDENTPFSFDEHDVKLEEFKNTLIAELKLLSSQWKKKSTSDFHKFTKSFLIAFARCVFEGCGFQAPPRLSAKEALEDSMGITNLWKEYTLKWKLYLI